ncbi:MAG: ABC transporter permease [Thermoanaerobaculia bacterium]
MLRAELSAAAKRLARRPRRTAPLVAVLALAAGACLASFSYFDALLFREVPGVREPDRLVRLFHGTDRDPYGPTSYPDFLAYRDRTQTLSGVAVYRSGWGHLSAGGIGSRVRAQAVSDDYFSLLGVRPSAGGLFEAGVSGSEREIVLSTAFWSSRFGADPDVIGRWVRFNGATYVIRGVVESGFRGTSLDVRPDVWIPVGRLEAILPGMGDQALEEPGWRIFQVVGRLAPGVSLETARTDVGRIASALQAEDPEGDSPFARRAAMLVAQRSAALPPGDRASVARHAALIALVVGGVLAIACVNVANLLLVHLLRRRRELEMRLSLGATRGRLLLGTACEGLMLSGAGVALGLVIARALLPALASLRLPLAVDVTPQIDLRILIAAAALLLVATLTIALPTAWHTRRLRPLAQADALRSIPRQGGLLAFVGAQAALGVGLLLVVLLLARSLWRLEAIDPGFSPDGVLTASIDLGLEGVEEDAGRAFWGELVGSLEALPQVESVGLSSHLPLEAETDAVGVLIAGERYPVTFNLVGADYFRTLGVPLLTGRLPGGDADEVVVSESLAARLFPGRPALGETLALGPEGPQWRVVGIVGDVLSGELRSGTRSVLYLPYPRLYRMFRSAMTLSIRTQGDPRSLIAPLGRSVERLRPGLPLDGVATLSDHVANATALDRQRAAWLGGLALLATVLAVTGIYSVTAFTTAARRREMGIRAALGARRGTLARTALAPVGAATAMGALGGALLGVVAASQLAPLLFEISPTDPLACAGAPLLMVAVALLAGWRPAREAAHVDPTDALRET